MIPVAFGDWPLQFTVLLYCRCTVLTCICLFVGVRGGKGAEIVQFQAGERRLVVEGVSCGLDHMAAVIAVDRDLLHYL